MYFLPRITNNNPWMDMFISFIYKIPDYLKSGMYNWENKIFFIVKNQFKNSDITIVYPSNTEAAYNSEGGKSLYEFNSSNSESATVISFLRPQSINKKVVSDAFMLWLNKLKGYSIQYICDLDMDDFHEIQKTKIIVVIGHSEYWSRLARINFDQFVNNGRDAIVLSGNTMCWQVRYNDDKTKLICYKYNKEDPVNNSLLKTITWFNPALEYSPLFSIGVDWLHGALPEKGFTGWLGYKILRPESPILSGTGLNFHDTLSCHSVEYDGSLINGFNLDGDPILDSASLGFCKLELIGYDFGASVRDSNKKGYGTFIAFKKSPFSGNVINTGFNNWCSGVQPSGLTGGLGGRDSLKIKQITLNMFDLLLAHKNIFCSDVDINCLYEKKCVTIKRPQDLFELIPNPIFKKFTLQSLKFQIEGLDVYNLSGQKILHITAQPKQFSFELDFPPEANGLYIIRIATECGVITEKLIFNQ